MFSADALSEILPGDSEIRSGWQTNTMAANESGRHEWLLIIGDEAVLVRAARREDRDGVHDVIVRELQLGASAEVRLSYFTDRFKGGAGQLVGAELAVTVAGEAFKVEMEGVDDRGPFMHFVRHLRAAVGRSRGVVPRGGK
jgi:hypothetical protein